MKKFATTVLFLVIACAAVVIAFGCCNNQQTVKDWKNLVNNGEEVRQLKEQLDNQENDFKALAREVGISESKINSLSTSGLITEIKMRLENIKYVGTTLSEDDLKFISDVCVDDQEVIRKIRIYDAYIKGLKSQQNEDN